MKSLIAILIFLTPVLTIGQQDTVKRYKKVNWFTHNTTFQSKPFWIQSIVPVVLTSSALATNHQPLKQDLQDQIRAPFNGFTTSFDDYFQFSPTVLMYTGDLLKLKAQHSVWNQTKFLFFSEVLSGIVVYSLKLGLKFERPDGSNFNSFPSGHTAQSFTGAQVLFHEYKQTQPALAYSGYLFATTTGLFRIINNRHWVPDVLLGSAIGFLSANLIYHFKPLKNWTPKFIKEKSGGMNLLFTPTFNANYVGAHLKLNL
ncbi:MAG: phosphatase PAP2 family protein [Putridiphycobacter sp.]